MKSILEDIKSQQYKNVYLLYGPEAYLKCQYRDKLCKALHQEKDAMNFSRFEGKEIKEGGVIDLAETMPFFADRRVILLEDTGFYKDKADTLADYMMSLPEYLCMIFVENEIDKRSRMYKAVQKAGGVVEFAVQDQDTLHRWVLGMIRRENKRIARADLELFFTKCGTDMGTIKREMEKLLCYTMNKEVITAADIEEVCATQVTNKIFDMVRAVTARKQKKALDLYYDLLSLKEPPMKILALISREFNLMLQVKVLQNEGYDVRTMASKTGLRDFAVKKYLPLIRHYTFKQLQSAMEDCILTETDVKTGRLSHVLSVELLIVKYSLAVE